MNLRIHSFESFGTVDGPGIRFVVFFQGCHLRCLYCHNRDSWDMKAGRVWDSGDLAKEVAKYQPYFKSSGGGVTASGGDPVLQASGVADFFRHCHRRGIHTTLDTSGSVPLTDAVKELIDHTDLVLLDIKQMDDTKHIALTGKSNVHTLAFAEYLSSIRKPFWIRYVVVPGWSDDLEDVQKLGLFGLGLSSLQRIEILPYHSMGVHKWEILGDPYSLVGVEPPLRENIIQIVELLSVFGHKVIST